LRGLRIIDFSPWFLSKDGMGRGMANQRDDGNVYRGRKREKLSLQKEEYVYPGPQSPPLKIFVLCQESRNEGGPRRGYEKKIDAGVKLESSLKNKVWSEK